MRLEFLRYRNQIRRLLIHAQANGVKVLLVIAAGNDALLTLSTSDVGDQIYDTVVLLDNIRLSPLVVAVGDSLTAGFQSGVLVENLQRFSYPARIAELAGVALPQPLLESPGSWVQPGNLPFDLVPACQRLGRLGGPAPSNVRRNSQEQAFNLAVAGATVKDMRTRYQNQDPFDPEDNNPLFQLVLQGPLYNLALSRGRLDLLSQLGQTLLINPSLVILWAGNNDALGAATSADLGELTDLNEFHLSYRRLLQGYGEGAVTRSGILSTGTDVVVANIPGVTVIPHMLRVGQRIGELPSIRSSPCTSRSPWKGVRAASDSELAFGDRVAPLSCRPAAQRDLGVRRPRVLVGCSSRAPNAGFHHRPAHHLREADQPAGQWDHPRADARACNLLACKHLGSRLSVDAEPGLGPPAMTREPAVRPAYPGHPGGDGDAADLNVAPELSLRSIYRVVTCSG